jgi:hypothetical protein
MSGAKLDSANVDDVSRMLMALVQEVWIMRDRMAVTEQLLEDKLGITPGDIDDFVGSPEYRDAVRTMRDQFAMRIVGAPIAARERSVSEILERAGFGNDRP